MEPEETPSGTQSKSTEALTGGGGSAPTSSPITSSSPTAVEGGESKHRSFLETITMKQSKPLVDALQNAVENMKKYSDITAELNGDSIVWMEKDDDIKLFREIKQWKEEHPTATIIDANHEFIANRNCGFFSKADSFTRILFYSKEVDYVLKFEDRGKFGAVRAAWERKLVRSGLVLELDSSFDPKEVYVKIFTPFYIMSREAERQKIRLLLKVDQEDPLQKGTIEEGEGMEIEMVENQTLSPASIKKLLDEQHAELVGRPGSIREFFRRAVRFFDPRFEIPNMSSAIFRLIDIEKFVGGDDIFPCLGEGPKELVVSRFFSPSKRNLLTFSLVTKVLLSPKEIQEIANPNLKGHHRSMGINHLLNQTVYAKFYPLHDGSSKQREDSNLRSWLEENWARKLVAFQPLDAIKDYFGEKIAFYFAFLGYYTMWLFPMAFVGVACFVYGVAYSVMVEHEDVDTAATVQELNNIELIVGRIFDNAATIPFAAITCIWATLFIEFWKRKNAHLAYWWDVHHFEEVEVARPEWYGTRVRRSPITGKKEYFYPGGIRNLKMLASFFLVVIAILFILISLTATVVYTAWANNYFGSCSLTPVEQSICVDHHVLHDSTGEPLAYSCSSPCYSHATVSSCESASCHWYNDTGSVPTCGPACLSFTYGVDCNADASCIWKDTYFIADITASLLNLFVIVLMNKVFEGVAATLNEWENHRTEKAWESALIMKTFFFQFLNSYTTLFYLAFFKGSVATKMFGNSNLHDFCEFGSCFNELMIQLAIVFLGKQFFNQFLEVIVPTISKFFRRKREQSRMKQIHQQYHDSVKDRPIAPQEKTPQWILDDYLDSYQRVLFDDYNEMAQQFGFITLFVAAFPLAPLFALVNNIMEIRTDSFKMITVFQRPPAIQARDIGAWETIINVLGILAVITNAFILGFTSNWVSQTVASLTDSQSPNEILAGRLVLVIVFEHFVIGCKLLFAFLIPDVPASVKLAVDRENYLTALKINGVQDENEAEGEEDDHDILLETLLGDMTKLQARARTNMKLSPSKQNFDSGV